MLHNVNEVSSKINKCKAIIRLNKCCFTTCGVVTKRLLPHNVNEVSSKINKYEAIIRLNKCCVANCGCRNKKIAAVQC